MEHFHFLRPEWLWGLLALPLLWFGARKISAGASDWSKAIDPRLLSHLTPSSSDIKTSSSHWLLVIAVLTSLVAMAGPSWEEKPQPVQKISDDMVIVLDLSLSMLSNDTPPTRLQRAKQKLIDLLDHRTEGNTALIAYSGDSHIVTPLTDDIQTIKTNLPALDPFVMPVIGSRPELAIEQAISLLKQGKANTGRIVFISDDIKNDQIEQIRDLFADSSARYSLWVLAAGTAAGGPIDIPGQGYLKEGGNVVIPQTDFSSLSTLAKENGGAMASISLTDQDLISLGLTKPLKEIKEEDETVADPIFDAWVDAGYWLLLIVIPLLLIAHRKGALLILLVTVLPMEDASAFSFKDLWATKDQQGQTLMEAGQYEEAAKTFKSPRHQANAFYKSGDFEAAANQYEAIGDATAFYNQGNALAQAQDFQGAIAAYDKALELQPDHEDATHNKKILEELLEQQESNQNQSGDQNQDQDSQSDQNQSDSDSQQGEQNQDQQGNNSDPSSNDQGSNDQGTNDQNSDSSDSQNQQSQDQQQDQDSTDQQQNSEQSKENESNDSQQAQTGDSEDSEQEKQNQTQATRPTESLSEEEQQSFEQWMRRVPDDPSGLLRRKFEQQSRERNRLPQNDGEPIW